MKTLYYIMSIPVLDKAHAVSKEPVNIKVDYILAISVI